MKNLSKAAKQRISPDPITRSEYMSELAKLRHANKTPEERKAHALKMVAAKEAKRQARLSRS